MNLPWEGGIVEDHISTRSLTDGYSRLTGREMLVSDIAERALTEEIAKEVFDEYGASLGSVLNAFCSGFRPDTIVFGGGIARSALLFLPRTVEQLTSMSPTIIVSTLFEFAAFQGAARFYQDSQRSI